MPLQMQEFSINPTERVKFGLDPQNNFTLINLEEENNLSQDSSQCSKQRSIKNKKNSLNA